MYTGMYLLSICNLPTYLQADRINPRNQPARKLEKRGSCISGLSLLTYQGITFNLSSFNSLSSLKKVECIYNYFTICAIVWTLCADWSGHNSILLTLFKSLPRTEGGSHVPQYIYFFYIHLSFNLTVLVTSKLSSILSNFYFYCRFNNNFLHEISCVFDQQILFLLLQVKRSLGLQFSINSIQRRRNNTFWRDR